MNPYGPPPPGGFGQPPPGGAFGPPPQNGPPPYGGFGPPPYNPYGPPQMGFGPPPKQSTLAIVSLVCAIFSVIFFIMGGPLFAIGGVITGHLARKEIRKSNGSVVGDGLALGGLIVSYLALVGTLLFAGAILAAVLTAPATN